MSYAIYGCFSRSNGKKNAEIEKISFYPFPKEPKFCNKYVNVCGRSDKVNITEARICSRYLQESDCARNLKHELLSYCPSNATKLKEDALPNQHLHIFKISTVDPGN